MTLMLQNIFVLVTKGIESVIESGKRCVIFLDPVALIVDWPHYLLSTMQWVILLTCSAPYVSFQGLRDLPQHQTCTKGRCIDDICP